MDTIIGKIVVFFYLKNKVYRNIQFSVHKKEPNLLLITPFIIKSLSTREAIKFYIF
jgi:hypothetical protein